MNSNSKTPIFWEEEFFRCQGIEIEYIKVNETLLPYKLTDKSVQVGFVGPYSLAYSRNLREDDVYSSWQKLRGKYPEHLVEVRLPPQELFPEQYSLNSQAIESLGFEMKFADLNSAIEIDQNMPHQFNRNRRRELKKAFELGLSFELTDYDSALRTIEINRKTKNVPVSITKERLATLAASFESEIAFYGVKDSSADDLSSAVTIRVDESLVYVFMWGHNPEFANAGISMAMLAEGILRVERSRGAKWLCLGTSSVLGVVDQGLLDFKTSLGSKIQTRETWVIA